MPAIHYRKTLHFSRSFFPSSPAPHPRTYFFPSSPTVPSPPPSCAPPSPLRWRSSMMMKSMKRREWRMEVLSLPKSASICPLNPPHRAFMFLPSGVVHYLCCAPAFHDLPVEAVEVDEARLIGAQPVWVWLIEAPPVEDSSGWALLVEAPPSCWPLPLQLLVAWARLGLVLPVEALLPSEVPSAYTHLPP
jgi:hypothetical protein